MRLTKLRRWLAWFLRDRSMNYERSYRAPDLHHDHVGWSDQSIDRDGPAHDICEQAERQIQRRRKGTER